MNTLSSTKKLTLVSTVMLVFILALVFSFAGCKTDSDDDDETGATIDYVGTYTGTLTNAGTAIPNMTITIAADSVTIGQTSVPITVVGVKEESMMGGSGKWAYINATGGKAGIVLDLTSMGYGINIVFGKTIADANQMVQGVIGAGSSLSTVGMGDTLQFEGKKN